MMVREETGWVPISAQELCEDVRGMRHALNEWGVSKGDRVAILSENRPEWTITDFACLQLGGVVVPIYSTLAAQQVAFILSHSGSKVVVVSTQQQLEKVLSIKGQTRVQRVVVMDEVKSGDAVSVRRLMRDLPVAGDRELEARARAVKSEDLASIIYTSGTTGIPKGVKLTHGNLTSNMRHSLNQCFLSAIVACDRAPRRPHLLHRGVTLAYCPFIENPPQALQEVRPHILIAVPRVYEKLYSQVEQTAKGLAQQAVYRWALLVGRANVSEISAGRMPTAAA